MSKVTCFLALFLTATLRADVRLAGIFSDHMVVQQGVKLPVWGRADVGETITVTVGERSATMTAGADGKWRVELEPLAASDQPIEITVSGKNQIKISDVLVGEVWLASGQSNMQYALKDAHNKTEALPAANDPQLRFCIVGNRPEIDPLDDRKVEWKVCTPETARGFSAVAYFFGRELRSARKTPVGLIGSYVSGSRAEWWAPMESIKSSPVLSHYADKQDELRGKLSATTNPSEAFATAPASRYNGMIAPLQQFPIKGVIWYQGESNVGDYAEYRTLFPALITGWRKQWGADFTFLFVQLPGNGRRDEAVEPSKWAMMRVAQTEALKLPNTGMAVTLDLVPKRALLHPKNKEGVGKRLAMAARCVAYGEKIEIFGPTFDSMKIDAGKARVHFNHADSLRIAAPPQENLVAPTTQPTAVKGFCIAGEDRKFVLADASIEGDCVMVSSDQVTNPVAVRYGWADNPEVNLYNGDLLPAEPFRTDDWPE